MIKILFPIWAIKFIHPRIKVDNVSGKSACLTMSCIFGLFAHLTIEPKQEKKKGKKVFPTHPIVIFML